METEKMGNAAASAPAIEIINVGKTFDTGLTALDNTNLAINTGSFTCLLGPSGCGKSTLLRLIAGLDVPSTGEIKLAKELSESLGYVFQEPALMPWSTVSGNVRFPLKLSALPKSETADRIAQTLELVGLSEFANAYPATLSGGMKMRVSIARALVTKPKLLLMDEPFAALDEMTRFRLNDELLAFQQKLGLTIIFVTHSIFEAAYLGNHIALLQHPKQGPSIAETVENRTKFPRSDNHRKSAKYLELVQNLSNKLEKTLLLD